jgi:hypothetical protein
MLVRFTGFVSKPILDITISITVVGSRFSPIIPFSSALALNKRSSVCIVASSIGAFVVVLIIYSLLLSARMNIWRTEERKYM